MTTMPKSKRQDLSEEEMFRLISEHLSERLLDRAWEPFRRVFERPDVKRAERVIWRALAEAFAPKAEHRRRRRN